MAQRFEGRNLEEALKSAAGGLGVEQWQLTWHTLLEKRGFLGGMKRIVIEAEVNSAAQPPAAPPVSLPPLEGVPSRGDRSRSRERGPRERGPRDGGRTRGGRSGGRSAGGRGEPRPRRMRETLIDDVPPQGEESTGARAVREWCEKALELSGLELIVRSEEMEDQIQLRLYGADADILVNRNGEALDALQVLANKALVGRNVEKDVELDCEDFKERRAEQIERKAFDAAEQVRREGGAYLLPPMSPIERRIVHVALADEPDVMTESQGDGFFKRVAVKPRDRQDESTDRRV